MPLFTSSTVVEPSTSENVRSINCSLVGSSWKVQVITSRLGLSISVYSPLASASVPSGWRITIRTVPPTRRSTSASGVSQSWAQWNQRRITSGLVQASKTSSAGAGKVRSIRTTWPGVGRHRRSFLSSRYSPTTSKRRSQRSR
jgi:hypothetical protein